MQSEPFAKIIEHYFERNTQQYYWALAVFTLIVLIIQILQTLFVSRKIEKFKNELKKSEIKFSRFNQLQIDALKKIYDEFVTFHFKNYRLFYPTSFGHDSLKLKIRDWKSEYEIIMELLHREKILLTPNLKKEIKSFEKIMKKISDCLILELQSLSEIEAYEGSDDVQVLYQTPENETEAIKNRIQRLQKIDEVSKSEEIIKRLKENIEKYFESLID